MQSVPAPLGLARPALAFVVALLATGALVLVVAVAAHGPTHAQSAPRTIYQGLIQGVPLQSAHCTDWNAGTAKERDAVSAALAYSVGGATPYGPGTTLTTAETHSLFDRACASAIAQHWLLYELYIRAAGFRSYMQR